MITPKPLHLAIIACSAASPVWADDNPPAALAITSPLVVTATRVEQNSFDLPMAIDQVEQEQIQDAQLQMTLSESLIRVPGVTAQNRNQLAQDPQISIRGFGARSSFGVRGIRLYVDGIPLSMPDGIGQPGIVDLASMKSIEVLRGPFSALYGSSSGGVINMLTEDAPAQPTVSATAMFGSYDTRRQILKAGGSIENLDYQLETSHYESDGYRDHSASKKDMATAKFKFNISEDTRLTALVNWFDQPETQDPQGLDRDTAFSHPKSVYPSSIRADTRVARDHTQVGFNLEHRFNADNDVSIVAYGGNRNNLQYLSTSATGASGRASQIERDFWGMDAHWNNAGHMLQRSYKLSLGLSYGEMNDDRLDTNTTDGVINGTLNRDERQSAWNFDQYAQGQWSVLDSVDLHAGVRRSRVWMDVKDHLPLLNGDGTGNVQFEKTTPAIGAVWKVTSAFNLYANYGKGFETPSMIEISYADTAGNGPNLELKPSKSSNYEVGAKAFVTDNTLVNFTLFKIDTDDEIVVAASSFGRTVYTNAGATSRKGAEFSVNTNLPYNFTFNGAYSLLNAKFASDVNDGNRIPGTYREQIYGELAWRHAPSGFKAAFEGRYNSKVYVDDANSESAPSYTIFNLRAGFEQALRGWNFKEFARVENLFDKDYIGSIRVNDSNGRYYEPAPGRNWMMGLSASYRF